MRGPDLPGSLVLAALLVALVVSRVAEGHRVSDAVGALDSASATWTIAAEGAPPFRPRLVVSAGARGRRPAAGRLLDLQSLSVVGRTLTDMSKLSTVPGWVRPPPLAVARIEDFLLRLRGRTQSADTLGAWACLYWLVAPEGERDRGPLARRALPTESVVRGEFRVADAIAEGELYPGPAWWAQRGIPAADRMPVTEWDIRIGSSYERFYCHGVRVALGWVLGIIDEPALLAPIRDGDGVLIPPADRDAYAAYLREIARPTAPADEHDRA